MRRRNLQVSSAPHPLVLFSTTIIGVESVIRKGAFGTLPNKGCIHSLLHNSLLIACRTLKNTWCKNVRSSLNAASASRRPQFCMTSDETQANGISPYLFSSLSLFNFVRQTTPATSNIPYSEYTQSCAAHVARRHSALKEGADCMCLHAIFFASYRPPGLSILIKVYAFMPPQKFSMTRNGDIQG